MYFLNCDDKFTLTSSNAPVENYPIWDSGTTYNTDDIVIYNNRIYKSLIDSNNSEPGTDANWADLGATNPYKCIDKYINTQTANENDDLIMEFEVTKVSGIALINVIASSIKLELYDSNDNLIIEKEESAVTGISNWEDYFFGKIEQKNKFYTDLPFVYQGRVKLTIYKTDIAAVGVVLIGYLQDLGITLQGIRTGIDDYSKKVIDDYGNVYLQQGNYRDSIDCKVILKNTDFSTVKQRLTSLRAKPVLWLATKDEDYRELFLYGYYENFNLTIDNPAITDLNLTLKGLI